MRFSSSKLELRLCLDNILNHYYSYIINSPNFHLRPQSYASRPTWYPSYKMEISNRDDIDYSEVSTDIFDIDEIRVLEDYLNRDISNAISFKGNLIFGDFEGYIHVIDPLNGTTIAREKISKQPIKSIISRSNSFYAIDEEFNLFSLNI